MLNYKRMKGGLVVSCQALEDEPLHSPYIMSKMALAAQMGGAVGVRANTVLDILSIREEIELPIMGIIKKNYKDSQVYITPTIREVEELYNIGVDVIAIDATSRIRADGVNTEEFIKMIKEKFPSIVLMGDISSIEEGISARNFGCDLISTTLYGYTDGTAGRNMTEDDFSFLKELISVSKIPVVAEGRIDSPEKARRAIELGAWCVVVGGAITRPKDITRSFVHKMNGH